MMSVMIDSPQTYATHRRFNLTHMIALVILMVNAGDAIWGVWRAPSWAAFLHLAVAIALVLLGIVARTMVLTIQDRVIRLEMRLRLAEILPTDLKSRVGELTPGQLVGLRFASDEELPELVRKVLGGELRGGEEIKRAVKTWRADHLRA
jgi:hypothetical protein